jgi:hypothetical protein
MSDTEIPIKKKVVMTQERLDKLKIARESALAKKKQMKQLSENKKELKKVEFETELDNSKKALEKTKVETLKEEIVEPKVEPTLIKEKPKKINKPKPKPITPSSSSSDESSSSEEEEIVYKNKPKKKIQKSKSKYEIADEVTKDLLYKKIQDDNYKNLFKSMFPNYSVM